MLAPGQPYEAFVWVCLGATFCFVIFNYILFANVPPHKASNTVKLFYS